MSADQKLGLTFLSQFSHVLDKLVMSLKLELYTDPPVCTKIRCNLRLLWPRQKDIDTERHFSQHNTIAELLLCHPVCQI